MVAGPGSGKTFVLTWHISYLIVHYHVDPSSILVLTFSKNAAASMRRRFSKISRHYAPLVTFGTFHSVFFRILNERTGGCLHLISEKDKAKLIRQLADHYVSDRGMDSLPDLLDLAIAAYKSTGRLPENLPCSPDEFLQVCREYEGFLRDRQLIDYDDMILKTLELFKGQPDLARDLRKRYSFILIDEFQDISDTQYQLIRQISNGNLFVVGDDDQTIYGFRGSDPRIMQIFLEDHPEAVRLALRTNYRSTCQIIQAAERLIRENSDRIPKHQISHLGKGEPVEIRCFTHERYEQEALVRDFSGQSLEDLEGTAVIVRSHTQSIRITRALQAAGIPFQGMPEHPDALKKRILEDLEAWYCLASRAQAQEFLPGILQDLATDDLTTETMEWDRKWKRILGYSDAVTTRASREARIREQVRMLAKLRPDYGWSFLMRTAGFEEKALSIFGPDREREVREFLLALKERICACSTLQEACDLILSVREETCRGRDQGAGVHILTMHASKGLEFDRVYIPDLDEGILPIRQARSREEIEEERRLLYVTMTRARRKLFLYWICGTRDNPRVPSRFLSAFGIRPYE